MPTPEQDAAWRERCARDAAYRAAERKRKFIFATTFVVYIGLLVALSAFYGYTNHGLTGLEQIQYVVMTLVFLDVTPRLTRDFLAVGQPKNKEP